MVEGEPASCYSRFCVSCGIPRTFLFRVPEEVVLVPPGAVVFGDGTPSELLDALEWMCVAETHAQAARDLGSPDGAIARKVRQEMATAEAAIGEALAFVPAGAGAVPSASLRTEARSSLLSG